MNYQQHKFSLKFRNPDLELEYWTQKNDDLQRDLKSGLIQSIVLWSLAGLAFYYTDPEAYTTLAIIMAATTIPIFISIILLLQKKRFKLQTHAFAVVSNMIAAALILYIGFVIPNKLYPILVASIFVIFFGVYMYKFTKVATMAIVISYCLSYLLLILTYSKFEAIDLTVAVLYCLFIPIFAITASHASERKERELFVYQKLISIERDRSDQLLLNILPEEIAKRLKDGERIIADNYNQVTVLFADISKESCRS